MQQLNADAQEWFPANHENNAGASNARSLNTNAPAQGSQKYSAQSRLNKYRESPGQGHGHEQIPAKNNSDIATDFQYLQGIIVRLTADPGHFEEVIDIFMQTLHIHLHSSEMMQQLCTFIFTNAIEEPSFRYNAARLCVLIQDESLIFRQLLKDLCVKEVEKNRQQPGFTLFLAELYSQGNQSNWKMLYVAVNKLISLGGDEKVKTACQTLKLAGYAMENFDKGMMEDLLELLETKKPFVQRNISTLIESVMNLRTHKWGHSISATNLTEGSSGSSNSMPNGFMSDTFYGPGGEELTEAERRFLDGEMDDFDDPDELYDPEPEMDEEIQAAFREFVKMGK
ncbi:uncharacterized protein [Atheta coriaria]|uniref:uncharacterized protein n=1 Tax=Dalotia coriaria TaxID=877792 RepID=UPI0031F380F9